ncbi:hypothetical protein [Nitrospina watsonii]|uniref:Uncharacterized protein n=1 Tax=Nitrospina watsonii TaxID=1323948 RepID=A0ABN8VWC0_9BACT|nr:hypothetical protein [Nitrospina watsonii]CAI2718077.1 conserved protein of unknown function [Nitrospina watsonii]
MSITVLLLLVILLCGIGLAWILFPPQNTSPTRRAVKKRKTPGTAKAQTKAPPRERSADEVMMARAGMTEREAIRKVVEAFVAENPASSAKIIQNWLRER